MKILVGVKRVVDYNVRVQVKPDGSGVALDGVKMSVNPFDEIAVEEALRLKEAGKATEVIVVSIGTSASQEQLRTALAMGADRAILVETTEACQPLTVARIFGKLVEKEGAQLIILGKQAIDDDAGQTPQMLAALLDCAQASYASKIEIDGGSAKVTQEVDAGLQTIEVDLPAVISADLRLNEPRYVKLPDIMKAKKKPLETIALADLGVEPAAALKVIKTEAPAARSGGRKVASAEDLVAELKNKGLL
ncbi:electron transfer flavoprotein subunit beta/FixA family protein [Candidatus Macondimonas diazotrophica]|jgi:electron transfer flavoprotein beta subunit|uniref:Electron transfer flavoprotein subunit beta n=1 Tax=Candidatus Macondimonas diazotrophica TaxID=2305248 RepID=A0A4Z0FCE5_9GAMM|nr:electron transfer flavoprotein subunit beta/FixA family protein [Candidatus Macondimonas diazotrophica]NCU00675.1 electron transfer flavoprotein subunit beta/FixA family protein [Candidatus Macondimonas diazotrophica]TFZ83531.1 electron transfer flavoprotein subunit beta/FixA family protein [Candidatus Macondimonas diazotrophica]HBG30356.1 EtfB protein [Gammaproteobacteria bacterium]HBG50603.1 EtfB protein [Gammaproteobacteria bacterium]